MMKVTYLSHVLSEETPAYGGGGCFSAKVASSIGAGASSNAKVWTLSSHSGTHIDAPFHFSDAGRKLDEYPANFWIFTKPYLLNKSVEPCEIIGPGAWCESIPTECDLLLLKTGFETHRGTAEYWEKGPGLSPDLGRWLRCHRGRIRALGMDILSTTSWSDRPLGRVAHRAFLDDFEGHPPLLLIEDMSLSLLTDSPSRVTVLPVRSLDGDGGPATVIAESPG